MNRHKGLYADWTNGNGSDGCEYSPVSLSHHIGNMPSAMPNRKTQTKMKNARDWAQSLARHRTDL